MSRARASGARRAPSRAAQSRPPRGRPGRCRRLPARARRAAPPSARSTSLRAEARRSGSPARTARRRCMRADRSPGRGELAAIASSGQRSTQSPQRAMPTHDALVEDGHRRLRQHAARREERAAAEGAAVDPRSSALVRRQRVELRARGGDENRRLLRAPPVDGDGLDSERLRARPPQRGEELAGDRSTRRIVTHDARGSCVPVRRPAASSGRRSASRTSVMVRARSSSRASAARAPRRRVAPSRAATAAQNRRHPARPGDRARAAPAASAASCSKRVGERLPLDDEMVGQLVRVGPHAQSEVARRGARPLPRTPPISRPCSRRGWSPRHSDSYGAHGTRPGPTRSRSYSSRSASSSTSSDRAAQLVDACAREADQTGDLDRLVPARRPPTRARPPSAGSTRRRGAVRPARGRPHVRRRDALTPAALAPPAAASGSRRR